MVANLPLTLPSTGSLPVFDRSPSTLEPLSTPLSPVRLAWQPGLIEALAEKKDNEGQ
jgi:hypothetical protein